MQQSSLKNKTWIHSAIMKLTTVFPQEKPQCHANYQVGMQVAHMITMETTKPLLAIRMATGMQELIMETGAMVLGLPIAGDPQN